MSIEEIFSLMDSLTQKDKELIQKAYDFSFKGHEGQLRESGEPYFSHIFEVVKILANLKMSPTTIVAGLLHDSIEDGVATEEQIKKDFDDEVLFLVNGVTKLGKLKYSGVERHIESFRKFIVAAAEDIRVLIIKLADRLHNMRTLEHIRPDKQKRIALETLEIYAPLAYRLSMRLISRELEDLSFKFAYPKEYEETLKILKNQKEENLPNLEKFIKSVKKSLAEEGIRNFSMDYRQKGIYSLYKKVKKKKELEKIYDILALRIYVDTVTDCYKLLGIIHSIGRPIPGRIKDYIAFPKPNGYQSLHTTILSSEGSRIEVQIRTHEMHYNSEYGIASHIAYKKAGSKNKKEDSEVKWFRQFLPRTINYSVDSKTESKDEMPNWIKDIAILHNDVKNPKDKDGLMEDLKADFFNERIFVLTPKGDVIDLPLGSKVLDFAYAIHSRVGDHTNGARINAKMVSLDTILHNGDIVEVLTRESAKPSAKWMDMVKTNMAKRHINNYLEKVARKK